MKYYSNLVIGILIGVFLGVMGTLYYQSQEKEDNSSAAITIHNSIENLRKLVVVRKNYSKTYTFKDTKKYMYDFFEFDKKTILLVSASLEAGFDMKKLKVTMDTINKKIIVGEIPPVELNFNSNIKYLDLEQNSFNEFSAKELNKVSGKATAMLKKEIDQEALKQKARLRLVEELDNIYILANALGWTVELNENTKIKRKILN